MVNVDEYFHTFSSFLCEDDERDNLVEHNTELHLLSTTRADIINIHELFRFLSKVNIRLCVTYLLISDHHEYMFVKYTSQTTFHTP